MQVGFFIWKQILLRNRGIPYKYITNSLPRAQTPTFVDASTSIGIGGVHGYDYFSVVHGNLTPVINACPGWESFPKVPIAWIELLVAFVAVALFGPRYPGHLMVLYSDNTNVVAWLGSSRRSPNPTVCTVVAAIERIKYEYMLKLSVRYIPSTQKPNCRPPFPKQNPFMVKISGHTSLTSLDLLDALNPFRLPGTIMVKHYRTSIKIWPQVLLPTSGHMAER